MTLTVYVQILAGNARHLNSVTRVQSKSSKGVSGEFFFAIVKDLFIIRSQYHTVLP